MKTTTRNNQSIVVIQGSQANAIIKSLELSKGKKQLTVSDAIEQWVPWLNKNTTSQSALKNISYIRLWARDGNLGNKPLSSMEEEHVNEWVNADDGTKLSTKTIRLSVVRCFFRYCAIKELLTGPNPSTLASVDYSKLTHKQKEAKELIPFTPAEFDKIIAHLNEKLADIQPKIKAAKSHSLRSKLMDKREFFLFWKAATVISRCAGLRLGDVCQLEWECFKKKFTVWTDKRNRRVQPHIWNPELFESTVAQIDKEDDTYCFPERRRMYLLPSQRSRIKMQFGRLCAKLDMEGKSFHVLRHTYATECRASGIPIPHIAKSLGHSSIKTTEGYVH